MCRHIRRPLAIVEDPHHKSCVMRFWSFLTLKDALNQVPVPWRQPQGRAHTALEIWGEFFILSSGTIGTRFLPESQFSGMEANPNPAVPVTIRERKNYIVTLSWFLLIEIIAFNGKYFIFLKQIFLIGMWISFIEIGFSRMGYKDVRESVLNWFQKWTEIIATGSRKKPEMKNRFRFQTETGNASSSHNVDNVGKK